MLFFYSLVHASPWENKTVLILCTGRDVLSYIFLTQLPTYTLLSSFYKIRPTTIVIAYAITLFSCTIPFVFFRRSAYVHDLARAPSNAVSNRTILQDRPTVFYTTVVATTIFTTTLNLSYATWLPAHLVVHFENIPDITLTHAGAAVVPVLFLNLLPAGWAAKDFLFVSSAGALDDSGSKEKQTPSGKTQSYLCSLYCRTWGALSTKKRTLIQRTVILAAMTSLSTVVQLVGTLKGVDIKGASLWGGVWSGAILIIGLIFGWIEGVDGF